MKLTLLAAFAAVLAGFHANAETLTYRNLVQRTTDLDHLAVLPPPGEKNAMASSYDRASRYDAANDKYIDWGANDDGHGIVRDEGDMVVLADIQGPGCIWRIWSAAATAGHVKIYLDGADTPAVDLPFVDYFSGKGPFSVWKNLVYLAAGDGISSDTFVPGSNNYVPISFARSCKIVGDKMKPGMPDSGWGQYFHFNYTIFAPGTIVPAFKLPFTPEESAALDEANAKLGRKGGNPCDPLPDEETENNALQFPPGRVTTAFDLKGAGAITALKVKLDLPRGAEAQRLLLRTLTISITWDGESTPAVWSPLGDFFATVGGSGSFATMPVGLLDDGTFYCYWYMPFATGARIELGNDGDTPVPITVTVTHAPLDKPIASLMRFHAKWHRDAFVSERKDRWPDWPMLMTQGRGRFVGAMLHIWTPCGGWWGEGDEKFFVDGEKFPSTFGTGSEDYFGYAWSNPGRFVRPYHAQVLNESNMGHVDDFRWHISDSYPFQTSFQGCIEKYYPNEPANPPYSDHALYAAEAYWYLAPGGVDPYPAIPVAQRIGYWKPLIAKYFEPGVIEGEAMHTVTKPVHRPGIQPTWTYKPGAWSGDKFLVWTTDWGPGRENLELALPVEKAGKYKLIARFTKGRDFGIVQLTLDGSKLGDRVDLYSEQLAPADPVELGTADLTAGDHVLGVTLPDKNPAVTGRALTFGLDYIKLVPAP